MFFNKLLVAVDDSPPSQCAIDIGITIAKRDGCCIVFCLVLDPSLLAQNYGADSLCVLAESCASDILAGALKRAEDAGVEASAKTIYDRACQGITDLAATENAGMIVMGTHGRTGITRAVLRSAAEAVLRRTKTPLCVIRRPPIGKIHGRFLVPIVNDELANVAIRYAVELARGFDSTLLFCTVANGSGNEGAAKLLESATQIARENGVQSASVVLEPQTTIPDAILRQAGIEDTDAIIMATHARDGFMRLVKGSVTEAVIRSSSIPVVVIR